MGYLLAACAIALCALVAWRWQVERERILVPPDPADAAAVALAVIGDSDSHSYQDIYTFPSASPMRGGAFRQGSLQWTEVLDRLRHARVVVGGRVVEPLHVLVEMLFAEVQFLLNFTFANFGDVIHRRLGAGVTFFHE